MQQAYWCSAPLPASSRLWLMAIKSPSTESPRWNSLPSKSASLLRCCTLQRNSFQWKHCSENSNPFFFRTSSGVCFSEKHCLIQRIWCLLAPRYNRLRLGVGKGETQLNVMIFFLVWNVHPVNPVCVFLIINSRQQMNVICQLSNDVNFINKPWPQKNGITSPVFDFF